MTEQYTPTTDEVREEFIYGHQELDMDGNVVVSFDEAQARWDRWLAEVERAAAEKALTEAAKAIRHKQHAESVRQMLMKRAAALGLTAGGSDE